MHNLAAEIQRARSDLRLTIGDIADLSGLPAEIIWALVDSSDSELPQLTPREALQLVDALGCQPELSRLLRTRPDRRTHGMSRQGQPVGLPTVSR